MNRGIQAALIALINDAKDDHRWLKLDGPNADLARALQGIEGDVEEADIVEAIRAAHDDSEWWQGYHEGEADALAVVEKAAWDAASSASDAVSNAFGRSGNGTDEEAAHNRRSHADEMFSL